MKVFPTLLLLLFTLIAQAQNITQDIVHLKDGSIIRGSIVEQILDKSVKIRIIGDNVLVYPMNEVEKISKVQASRVNENSTKGNTKEKGYLGLSVAASIPLGDFGSSSNGLAELGIQVSALNFGLLFTEHLGISTTLSVANNPTSRSDLNNWSYGTLLAGPLVSFQLNEKITIDGRLQMGYAVATAPDLGMGKDTSTSIAYNAGIVCRYKIGKSLALLLTTDLLYAKPEFEDYGFDQNMNTLSIGIGGAYSF